MKTEEDQRRGREEKESELDEKLTKALSQSSLIGSLYRITESLDGWKNLLSEVVLVICEPSRRGGKEKVSFVRKQSRREKENLKLTDLELRLLPDLVRVVRSIGLTGSSSLPIGSETEDVLHHVSGLGASSSSLDSKSDLDLRLALRVGVVFGVLSESLEG